MSVTSFSPAERETTITTSDVDDLVHIWSAQRKHITKMRRNPAFTEVRSGLHGSSEWAAFTIPVDRWSPLGVKRSVSLTEQQREERRTRLLEAREGSK